MASQKVTTTDLATFTTLVQGLINAHWEKMGYTHSDPDAISFTVGPKYARIVRSSGGQASVYGFVDLASGDLLKADGWKTPAKHARGNLFSATPLAGCGPYGMAYLR